MEFIKLPRERWSLLVDLFRSHARMRYYIDSVIQGYTTDYGDYTEIFVDSNTQPSVVQLKMASDIFFAGDPKHPAATAMIEELPETAEAPNWSINFFGALVTPETDSWRDLISCIHKDNIVQQKRIEYSSDHLNIDYLKTLIHPLPEGFEIRAFDEDLAEYFRWDLDHQGLALISLRDFFRTGIGYCILKDRELVCSAYSWVRCDAGIEINVRTDSRYERKGLATACVAQLIVRCMELELIPHWSTTNNPISDKFAAKLGFTQRETYEVIAPAKNKRT